jgi:hypothetical protein
MKELDYEILDLGLVYYKNAVENPQEIIDIINSTNDRFSKEEHGSSYTSEVDWVPWQYGDGDNKQTFCWQKFFPQEHDISDNDYYAKERKYVSKRLYDALDMATDHYSNQIYPFAGENIKSREFSIHLLRYEKGGYLPAHQDHGVSSRVLSSVMYLNDDYEGGEMIFQNSGISIKPEAGSIIYFPSNFLYVHEVAEIKSGTRYSMPHWYHNMHTPIKSTGEA